MEITDAEYRVVGEPRWNPFKRWLYPRLAWLAGRVLVLTFAFAMSWLFHWLLAAFTAPN